MTELRSALRALRATPVVTLVVILSLALAIGANTAMFSLVDSLLLRALPVERPERLVSVEPSDQGATWSYRGGARFMRGGTRCLPARWRSGRRASTCRRADRPITSTG